MHIQTALNLYKTKTRLAQVLGVSGARVSQWGDTVPELYACKLQILSNGRLSASLNTSTNASADSAQNSSRESQTENNIEIDNIDTDPQQGIEQ